MAEIIESYSMLIADQTEKTISSRSVAESYHPNDLYPRIPNFQGGQHPRSDARDYLEAKNVYAYTSHGKDHDMHPGLIIKPSGDEDIKTAIRYAKDKRLKISIKSGGHQYSGACSTSGPNIMMDLAGTYPEKPTIYTEGNDTIAKISVSQSLGELNEFLSGKGLFVPHGQCRYVRIGGHAQTGGYGNLARAFGLFGDHVRKIRLFDHSAQERNIVGNSSSDEDCQLFKAILGGSPGNFGVITHYHVQVHRDSDYKFGNITPRYVWGFFWYSKKILKNCLDKVAEMADDPNFGRNYDLCISVLSGDSRLALYGPEGKLEEFESPEEMGVHDEAALYDLNDSDELEDVDDLDPDVLEATKVFEAESESTNGGRAPLPVIAIYAQWVPFTENDKYDPKWFRDLIKAGRWYRRVPGMFLPKLARRFPPVVDTRPAGAPMSKVTSLWLFNAEREFDLPYEKRTYLTTSTSLKGEWVGKVADQIDIVVKRQKGHKDLYDACRLAVQIQCYGGKNSKFNTNQGNDTSFSWRDSTVVQVLDCFYKAGRKDLAEGWQKENDRIMKGKGSVFGEQDRRVLWGSYGDWDMEKSWKYYYEDEAKYKQLGEVRGIADPDGTFTPNPFAVKAIPPKAKTG